MTNEDVAGMSVDSPKVANLVQPLAAPVVVMTEAGPVPVDMKLFAAAEKRLGGVGKFDTMSIQCYRNAKGELVPDYDSIRIERRKEPSED